MSNEEVQIGELFKSFEDKIVRLETKVIMEDGANLVYIGKFKNFVTLSDKSTVMLGRNYTIHEDYDQEDYIELNETTGKYELIEDEDKPHSEIALVSLSDIVSMHFY